MRIAEGDEVKTTCVTKSGAFEFLVMRFSLTNALVIFCTLMNQLFKEYFDKFLVVYLDDIVAYSQTLEEHVEHLRTIFKARFIAGYSKRATPLTELLKKEQPWMYLFLFSTQ